MAKEEHRRYLKSYLCSRSAYRRQELCTGIAMEHGKQPCNDNRNDTNEELVRSKVETGRTVADEAVVVMTAGETRQERRASHNGY